MSLHLHIDPFSGISGDMFLGALLDVGAPLEQVRATVARLGIDGWSIEPDVVTRHGITGTLANVTTADQADHRSAATLRRIIHDAGIDAWIAGRSIATIDRLAAVEAAIHGVDVDDVHLHEIGALDTLVDIVGSIAALRLLGIDSVSVSPLPTGSGTVRTAHGLLPVPAPATLALLAGTGIAWRATDDPMELVTPSGAALLAELASPVRPTMTVDGIGHGFGQSTRLPHANMTRVSLGRVSLAQVASISGGRDSVVELRTAVDDQPAELVAHALGAVVEAGAIDAWQSPISMKKGRLGTELTVLVHPDGEERVVETLFRFTTTLGIRRSVLERHMAERHIETVDVDGLSVRRKVRSRSGKVLGVKAEFDDCVVAAASLGTTPADVARRAELEPQDQRTTFR